MPSASQNPPGGACAVPKTPKKVRPSRPPSRRRWLQASSPVPPASVVDDSKRASGSRQLSDPSAFSHAHPLRLRPTSPARTIAIMTSADRASALLANRTPMPNASSAIPDAENPRKAIATATASDRSRARTWMPSARFPVTTMHLSAKAVQTIDRSQPPSSRALVDGPGRGFHHVVVSVFDAKGPCALPRGPYNAFRQFRERRLPRHHRRRPGTKNPGDLGPDLSCC